MNGHVFVLRGDLTTFACDAVLVPTDARWNVVAAHWGGLLPPDRLSDVSRRGWARIQVDHASAAWADMPVDEHGRMCGSSPPRVPKGTRPGWRTLSRPPYVTSRHGCDRA